MARENGEAILEGMEIFLFPGSSAGVSNLPPPAPTRLTLDLLSVLLPLPVLEHEVERLTNLIQDSSYTLKKPFPKTCISLRSGFALKMLLKKILMY